MLIFSPLAITLLMPLPPFSPLAITPELFSPLFSPLRDAAMMRAGSRQGVRQWSPEHAMPLFSLRFSLMPLRFHYFAIMPFFAAQRHYAAAIAIARRLRFFSAFRHFSFFSDMPRRHYADAASPIFSFRFRCHCRLRDSAARSSECRLIRCFDDTLFMMPFYFMISPLMFSLLSCHAISFSPPFY
jgi:hypothetical protein